MLAILYVVNWYYSVPDVKLLNIIEFKIFKTPRCKAKTKAPTNICKNSFLNKCVELMNLPHIFHDPVLKACSPNDIRFDDPTVVYPLVIPIRSEIFNFDKFW